MSSDSELSKSLKKIVDSLKTSAFKEIQDKLNELETLISTSELKDDVKKQASLIIADLKKVEETIDLEKEKKESSSKSKKKDSKKSSKKSKKDDSSSDDEKSDKRCEALNKDGSQCKNNGKYDDVKEGNYCGTHNHVAEEKRKSRKEGGKDSKKGKGKTASKDSRKKSNKKSKKDDSSSDSESENELKSGVDSKKPSKKDKSESESESESD